jgi:hypothetical protein
MGQMRVRRTGPWVKISCPFSWVQFKTVKGSDKGSNRKKEVRNLTVSDFSVAAGEGFEFDGRCKM